MPLDPDTEIQYRKGGKIMKKMPRKFSAGGAAPTSSPDRVPPAVVNAAKQDERVKREREANEKARSTMLGPRPTEKPPVAKKKGGKVKKFEGGDMVTLDTRERRADERKEPAPIVNLTSPEAPKVPLTRRRGSDQFPQTQAESAEDKAAMDAASAMASGSASSYGAQAAQDAPQGIKGGEHVVKPVTNTAPKAAAPKRVAPKAAPKKVAPKLKPGNDVEPYARREEQTEPQIKRDSGVTGRRDMYERRSSSETGTKYDNPRFTKPETDPSKMSDMDRYFHNKAKRDEAERKARAERLKLESQAATAAKGIAVYKKGGGVEAKGKTKGKIVKMAKGGSVRGYGVSKVTNKTKYV